MPPKVSDRVRSKQPTKSVKYEQESDEEDTSFVDSLSSLNLSNKVKKYVLKYHDRISDDISVGELLDLIDAATYEEAADLPSIPKGYDVYEDILWDLPQMDRLEFKQSLISLSEFEKARGQIMSTPCKCGSYEFHVRNVQRSSADEIATTIRICVSCN